MRGVPAERGAAWTSTSASARQLRQHILGTQQAPLLTQLMALRHRSRPYVPFHCIFWGPPGTGKTTLAQVIANTTKSYFETLSAVMAGKVDLREVVEKALERRKLYGQKTILFVKDVVETSN